MYVGSVLAQPPTTKTIIGGIYFAPFIMDCKIYFQQIIPAMQYVHAKLCWS